jgi:hypothetical protein
MIPVTDAELPMRQSNKLCLCLGDPAARMRHAAVSSSSPSAQSRRSNLVPEKQHPLLSLPRTEAEQRPRSCDQLPPASRIREPQPAAAEAIAN